MDGNDEVIRSPQSILFITLIAHRTHSPFIYVTGGAPIKSVTNYLSTPCWKTAIASSDPPDPSTQAPHSRPPPFYSLVVSSDYLPREDVSIGRGELGVRSSDQANSNPPYCPLRSVILLLGGSSIVVVGCCGFGVSERFRVPKCPPDVHWTRAPHYPLPGLFALAVGPP